MWNKGPTENRTRVAGFKVPRNDHYTTEPEMPSLGIEPRTYRLQGGCSTTKAKKAKNQDLLLHQVLF